MRYLNKHLFFSNLEFRTNISKKCLFATSWNFPGWWNVARCIAQGTYLLSTSFSKISKNVARAVCKINIVHGARKLCTHFYFIDWLLQWTMILINRLKVLSVLSCRCSFWYLHYGAYPFTGVTGAIELITITPCNHRMSLLILSYHGPVITATTPMQLLLLPVKCVKVARSIITVLYRWPNPYHRRLLIINP